MEKARSTKKASKGSSKGLNEGLVLTQSNQVLTRKSSDGTIAVILIDQHDRFVQIDGLAAKIWTMIDGKTTVGQIKKSVFKEDKKFEARFDKDLTQFIKKLHQLKFLKN